MSINFNKKNDTKTVFVSKGDYMQEFHTRLKEQIYARNLNVSKMAKMLNIATQSMHEWVSGKSLPNLTRFKQICEILQIDANYLLGLNPNAGGGC